MTKQMTNIAMMMVLAMGLMTSAAMAQKGDDVAPVGLYTGVQTNEGILDPASGMTRGNSFVLNSYGEWETHQLTISIDYQPGIAPNNFTVSGGSFSLLIFRDGELVEAVYGAVRGGSVAIITDENNEPSAKQVSVMLSSGGSLGKDGKKDKEISGSYNAITDLNSRQHQTSGSLSMAF
ncbi:MAG: hypothetical protein ACKVQW_09445 [Pyrinomonadaceae bacterium]